MPIVAMSRAGLWPDYWELLNLLEENAVFVREQGENPPASIGDARRACPNAVVIGAIQSGTQGPVLNPSDDTQLGCGDSLIFVAKHFSDCEAGIAVEAPGNAKIPEWRNVRSEIETVLILGWSRIVPKVLENLFSYQQKSLGIDVIGITSVEDRDISIESVLRAQKTGAIRHIQSNFMDPDEAARINPRKYDAILMIARERLESEAVADAATISAYLTVDSLLEDPDRANVVVELQDEENEPLFDKDRVDVIVSPMIISYILSQVAFEPELGLVLQQLTRSSGAKIQFRSLDRVSAHGDCRFADIVEWAAARGETAIGVVASSDGNRETNLNPGADSRWTYEEIDQVIVLGAASSPG